MLGIRAVGRHIQHYFQSQTLNITVIKQVPDTARLSQTIRYVMASGGLKDIPEVDIDADGTFKYVLIKVYSSKKGSATEDVKTIVRGFSWGAFHGDIYDKTLEQVQALGLDSECVGGGRIKHEAANKKILVYGYSQGFGKADHEVTVGLLKKKYPGYNVSWSDDGY